MSERAIMLAAVNLMFQNVGKNGVTLNLSEALMSVPGIKPGADSREDLFHFNGRIEAAGEIAQIHREDYRRLKNKKAPQRRCEDGAAR